MSTASASETPAHVAIANQLAVQFGVITVLTFVVNVPFSLFALEFGIPGFAALLVVNLVVLWLVLRAVFAALDELLEEKLATVVDGDEP